MRAIRLTLFALVAIALLLVVGFGVAAWLWGQAIPAATPLPPLPAASIAPTPGTAVGRGTVLSLGTLFASSSQECQIEAHSDTTYQEGTLFTHQGMLRFDILMSSSTASLLVQSGIVTSTTQSLWQQSATGTMPETVITLPRVVVAAVASPLLLVVSYTCRKWESDMSLFVPPDVLN